MNSLRSLRCLLFKFNPASALKHQGQLNYIIERSPL